MVGSSASIPACVMRKAGESLFRIQHPDDGAAIAEKTGIFRGNRIRILSCNRDGRERRLTGYDEANSEQHIGGYLSLARQNPQCERSVNGER
jgi:hypothetical protein